MKVFFDTNVYVAEALLGGAAEQMVAGTVAARWRVYCSAYVLDEAQRVLVDKFGFTVRFAKLTCARIRRRSTLVADAVASPHTVPHDPNDSPILAAALTAGADYLITNDIQLRGMNPYQGLRIISLTDYFELLVSMGIIER